MPTILLAGGTGLIGRRLSEMLRAEGHTVRILTRKPQNKAQFSWNPATGSMDASALQGVDYVINLAGAGIADKRWTAHRKKEIIESREQSAHTLRVAFLQSGIKPKAYLSSSAIGYYGNSGEQWMTETSAPVDSSFLVECCRRWEAAADEVAALGIRTVKLRIGVVLAKEGGALAEFVKPLRFGVGGYFADGQAWYSWVHLDDVCRMFIWAIENQQVSGVFNAVAPNPVRNRDLVKAIAHAMHQPALIVPGPAFAMKFLLGEMAAVILNSNKVSAEKIQQAGFRFQHPEIQEALKQIFA
ncbi:MAG: TIGR01777 family protein [Lewinellaceae bacterium]|nr:TIGR01777 family protein [Lewinellaceae bacterium]